jgi:hypothetical protein
VIIIATSGSGASKEKLLGRWKGTFDNATINVEFKERLAVVSISFEGGGLGMGSVGYEVDGSEIKFGSAVATMTDDGAMVISGEFLFGNTRFGVPKTRLERMK